MLSIIADVFAEKARVRIVVRAVLAPNALLSLQSQIRTFNVSGCLRVVSASHIEIELESARTRLERLINFCRRHPSLTGSASKALEITWLPYQRKFRGFRVSL